METSAVINWRDNQSRRKNLGKQGMLIAFSHIHVPPKGQEYLGDYYIGIIELSDCRVTAQLTDIDPDDITLGMTLVGCLRRLHQPTAASLIAYGTKFRPLRDVS